MFPYGQWHGAGRLLRIQVPSVSGYDLLELGSASWSLSHQVCSHHLGPKSRLQQHSGERRMSLTDGHFDLV